MVVGQGDDAGFSISEGRFRYRSAIWVMRQKSKASELGCWSIFGVILPRDWLRICSRATMYHASATAVGGASNSLRKLLTARTHAHSSVMCIERFGVIALIGPYGDVS